MGMLLGIPPTTWLELWSGAIGAFVSAIGAAAVAWLVVKETNKHQSELAKKALGAQREDAAEALRVQRELLEQQIHEQRNAARHSECVRASSELLAGVHELVSFSDSFTLEDRARITLSMRVALSTLEIFDGTSEGLHKALYPCELTFSALSSHIFVARMDGDMDRYGLIYEQLNNCSSAVQWIIPKWWNSDAPDRERLSARIHTILSDADEALQLLVA